MLVTDHVEEKVGLADVMNLFLFFKRRSHSEGTGGIFRGV